MIPKVEGPEDIHYVDRLLAQLEAKVGPDRAAARPRHPRDRPRRRQRRGDLRRQPRMQGLSLGPADLAANRRMKTTRVGGGHPGYLVRQDPVDGDIEGRPRHLPAGPLALHDRPHGRRLRRQRHPPVLRPVRRHQGRRRLRGPVPQRLPARLRRAPGASTPCRSTSPSGCSPPTRPTWSTPARSSRPWATAPAPSCSTARWRTTPRSSSARSSSTWPRSWPTTTPSSPLLRPLTPKSHLLADSWSPEARYVRPTALHGGPNRRPMTSPPAPPVGALHARRQRAGAREGQGLPPTR